MDFTLSDEHRRLAETARGYLARHYPPERVGELADSAAGWDPDSWPHLVSMGWLDPALDPIGHAVLAEAAGHALYPGPWWATVGLAAEVYAAAGVAAGGPATLAWAETDVSTLDSAIHATACRAEPVAAGFTLHGTKVAVPDASAVGAVLVVATAADGLGVFAVDLAVHRDSVTPLDTVDGTRRLAELRLVATPAELVVAPGKAAEVLVAVRRRALTLLAAEAIGVASRALELAAAHAKTRTQFGRPIGAFQAVAHRIAGMHAAIELARSLTLRAAWCLAERDAGVDEAVILATIASREAAIGATEGAIQVLGGIGFTWDHPAHRWYKRALWIQGFEGFPRQHRARLAAQLLDGPGWTDPRPPAYAALT